MHHKKKRVSSKRASSETLSLATIVLARLVALCNRIFNEVHIRGGGGGGGKHSSITINVNREIVLLLPQNSKLIYRQCGNKRANKQLRRSIAYCTCVHHIQVMFTYRNLQTRLMIFFLYYLYILIRRVHMSIFMFEVSVIHK